MAKLFACQTFRDITAIAQQIFGGVGFTLEYDIQLYFRRAKQLQISWWNDRYLEELVAHAGARHARGLTPSAFGPSVYDRGPRRRRSRRSRRDQWRTPR